MTNLGGCPVCKVVGLLLVVGAINWGLVGAFAELTFNQGQVNVDRVGSDRELTATGPSIPPRTHASSQGRWQTRHTVYGRQRRLVMRSSAAR